jgi:hypothetical protein
MYSRSEKGLKVSGNKSDEGSEGSDEGSEGSDEGSEGSDEGSEGSDEGSEGSDEGSSKARDSKPVTRPTIAAAPPVASLRASGSSVASPTPPDLSALADLQSSFNLRDMTESDDSDDIFSDYGSDSSGIEQIQESEEEEEPTTEELTRHLFASILDEDTDEVKYILDRVNLDINATNRVGRTPLIVAAVRNAPEIVRLLLDKGADPNVRDRTGKTALEQAQILNYLDVVNVLNGE